jgi:hypothetical protein
MSTLENTITALVDTGAVLELVGAARCFLVGEIAWIGPERLFWYTAHGDCEADGHALDFDVAEVIDPTCVVFGWHGRQVARLTSIHRANVDDYDDYAMAFTIWRQVGPRMKPLIERARRRHEFGRPIETVTLPTGVAETAGRTR